MPKVKVVWEGLRRRSFTQRRKDAKRCRVSLFNFAPLRENSFLTHTNLLEAKKPVHVLPSGVARENDDITLDAKLFHRGQCRMQDAARL